MAGDWLPVRPENSVRGLRASRRYDAISEGDDRLEGLHGGVAVVLLLGFREVGVGDEVGVLLPGVVALGFPGPSLGRALGGPDVVGALGEALREGLDVRRQRYCRCIDWTRLIGHIGSFGRTPWL
jgi:hypothetical protein